MLNANVGAKSVEPPEGQSRLVRIELPGVEIEHHRAGAGVTTRECEHTFHDRKREQPKIPASADRYVDPANAQGCRRQLQDLPLAAARQKWAPRSVWHPIPV